MSGLTSRELETLNERRVRPSGILSVILRSRSQATQSDEALSEIKGLAAGQMEDHRRRTGAMLKGREHEDQNSVPRTHARRLTIPVTPAQGDTALLVSEGTYSSVNTAARPPHSPPTHIHN